MLLALTGMALVIAGCDSGTKGAKGFRLPDGNMERGKTAYVKLNCHTCHAVQGAELPPPSSKSPITGHQRDRGAGDGQRRAGAKR